MYDYMKPCKSASTGSRIQNCTHRSNTLERNCGGTWMPRSVRNYCGCWTRKTHCWLSPR